MGRTVESARFRNKRKENKTNSPFFCVSFARATDRGNLALGKQGMVERRRFASKTEGLWAGMTYKGRDSTANLLSQHHALVQAQFGSSSDAAPSPAK